MEVKKGIRHTQMRIIRFDELHESRRTEDQTKHSKRHHNELFLQPRLGEIQQPIGP